MKKLLLIALTAAAVLLLTSGVAMAGTISGTLTNNGPGEPTDIHITVLNPDWTITGATISGPITNPDGTPGTGTWTTTTGTNDVDVGGITQTCPMASGVGGPVPVGGTVTYNITVDGPSGSTSSWIAEWTYDAGASPPANEKEDKAGSYAGLGVDSFIQRSISISVADDTINFGKIRFGTASTQSTTVTVSSNDDWNLFVSGASDPTVSRGDILQFLGVSLASGADTGIGGLADGGFVELINRGEPTVESFFDVFVTLEPTHAIRPGYYKGYISFNAVQDY